MMRGHSLPGGCEPAREATQRTRGAGGPMKSDSPEGRERHNRCADFFW